MRTDDYFHLQRFVTAQEPLYSQALQELKADKKRSHWMWFIFPQMRGLGHSGMSQYYGISGAEEARAYLEHPILGFRLRQCTQTVLESNADSLLTLFGSPDDKKFHSSMTLFAHVSASPDRLFQDALDRWCDGIKDNRTLALLSV